MVGCSRCNNDENGEYPPNGYEPSLPQLTAPELRFNYVTTVLSWDAVTDATGYIVTLGGGSPTTITAATQTVDVSQFTTSGIHNLSVTAIGNEETHLNSNPAVYAFIVGTTGLKFDFDTITEYLVVDFDGDAAELEGTVYIPTFVNGKYVKSIAADAFENAVNVTNFVIPYNLEHIGMNAFTNTGFLNNHSNNSIMTLANWIVGYKSDGTTIGVVDIKDGIIGIADGAFSDLPSLSGANIPATLRFIGAEAFRSSGIKIDNFAFGLHIERIGRDAFLGTEVFPNPINNQMVYFNNWVLGVSGVLDGNQIIGLNTVGIADFAFFNSANHTTIDIFIPQSVTRIGNSAFVSVPNAQLRAQASSAGENWHHNWYPGGHFEVLWNQNVG